jgi:hypothetical protein
MVKYMPFVKIIDVKIEDNKIAAYLCRVEMFLE